ncbi:TetR family transcriptional regulator [Thioalkalicoccus limnaeus]|uniref:TetR family transcriptional regulator n=1 Tax=Thioalkalicoccus limnaeus TaxID=120681 RepID=A0ABV4BGZ2_9GAMM
MRRTKQEAEQTRHRLLDAAERVFLERGVSQATLEAIAREAGLTRGALYWHFRDKAELYSAMLERVRLPLERLREDFRAAPDSDPVRVIEQLCLAALERVTQDPQLRRVYTIVLHRCERDLGHPDWRDAELEGRRQGVQVFLDCFQAAARAGRIRPGVTPELAVAALESYFTGLVYVWLLEPQRLALATEAPDLIRVFLRGFLIDDPERPAAP